MFDIKQELLKYKENQKFIDFSKKLIQTKYEMLGVKIPNIRALVKNVKEQEINNLLKVNKTDTFEEILFKGFLLGKVNNLKVLKEQILNFLPYIDNWCTCDTVVASLKQLKKQNDMFEFFVSLTKDTREYYSRFGFVVLKTYYLKLEYIQTIISCILENSGQEYYIKMAKAWLIAEMCINYKSEVINILQSQKLDKFVQNKAIQKARESFRVDKDFKQKLLRYKLQ